MKYHYYQNSNQSWFFGAHGLKDFAQNPCQVGESR